MSNLTEDEITARIQLHEAVMRDLPYWRDEWRHERAVRRVARRDTLRDCRKRARHASEMKRRRKTIATRLKGFPDSDGWVRMGFSRAESEECVKAFPGFCEIVKVLELEDLKQW